MSEKQTTLEHPTTETVEQPRLLDVATRPNRTDRFIGGFADDQQKPWNYEELGREDVAGEYHEANFGNIAYLTQQMDALLGESGSVETPNFSASRVELPGSGDDEATAGHRYQLDVTVSNQDRISTTITVVNGRPELTYYTEPLDTETNPPDRKPSRYETGSWSPEDTAIDYVEQGLNQKLDLMNNLLVEKNAERQTKLKQSVGHRILARLDIRNS